MGGYATTGGGSCATEGPLDVCFTPVQVGPVTVPTPMPYSNTAECMMGIGEPVALFEGMPALNLASVIMMSTGDSEGIDPGGLVSAVFMEEAMASIGSMVLTVGGMPAWACGTTLTDHNMENAVGMYSSSSQSAATGC